MIYIKRFSIMVLAISLQYPVFAQVSNSAVRRINDLETGFYGRAYIQEDLSKRISRLENNVFGKASFDSMHDRLDRLERAIGKGITLKIEKPARPAQSKIVSDPISRSSDQKFADLLTKAQANVSLRRFNVAADELMSAIEINPKSSLAFRQLGDVLMELKDVEGAQEAYKACIEIDQYGENGKYAKLKLQPRFSRNARTRSPVSGGRVAPISPKGALNTFDSQVNEYKSKMNKEGLQGAEWRTQATGRETERIRQDTEQWLQDAQTYSTSGGLPFGSSRRGGTSGGTVWTSTSSKVNLRSSSGRRGDIIDVSRRRSNFVVDDGNIQSDNALKEAAERARYFSESANNLKEQLSQKRKKGDAELQQFGTNVYVRNYGSGSASSLDEKSQQAKP